MDKLESYRNTIKVILEQYYQVTVTQSHVVNNSEVSDRLALDENRDQYLWFRFGWDNSKLVQYIILYFCIKDNKIWVEIDATDLCVVDDLLAAGVPADDIVLGFHPPQKRQLTEFAYTQPST